MSGVIIRPYEARDRAAVRRICFLTGLAGDPVGGQWADAESFADMFTGYYTDREPESALVAEVDGVVAGYLLGCRDSTSAWSPAAVAARHVLRRGIAFRPGTGRYVWRAARDLVGDRIRRGTRPEDLDFRDPAYPAHLHVDLLAPLRGLGVGSDLVTRWLDTLRSQGSPGCHLQTLAENTAAVAFFEAMGFRARGEPVPNPGQRGPTGGRTHVLTMVRALG